MINFDHPLDGTGQWHTPFFSQRNLAQQKMRF
jgi:hypothetical protein